MTLQGIPNHVTPNQVFDFDIYRDPRLEDDLHVGYATLHEDAPDVFWTPANGGHWIVSRHDMISEIVRDSEHFSSSEMQIPRSPTPPVFIPLSLDPPDHLPYRQLLMPIFSNKSVNAMDEDLRAWASELIDAVAARGECDFVAEISARYPVGVFMRLMGFPWEKQGTFRRIAEEHFSVTNAEEMAASMRDIHDELRQFIEARRAAPQDDLLSHLITAEVRGRKMNDSELMSICALLFLAGLDTVTNVMSFGCRHIAGDRALQERLRGDPDAVDKFCEEVIRLFGVVNTPRLVIVDHELFGAKFRKGDMVLSLLPLAGRDERKNADAAMFDIDRPAKHHLTFSTGPHICLGHYLARSELKVFFREWFARIPEFQIASGAKSTTRPGLVMSLKALPLSWDWNAIR